MHTANMGNSFKFILRQNKDRCFFETESENKKSYVSLI